MPQSRATTIVLAGLAAVVLGALAAVPLAAALGLEQMAAADAVGWVGGALAVALNWPQAYRLWISRQYEGLSLVASVLGLAVPAVWFAYGLAVGSTVQWLSNALVLVGAVAVLAGQVVVARVPVARWLPGAAAVVLGVGTVAVVGGPAALGTLATVVTAGAGVQGVVYLARRHAARLDTSGVSLARVAMIFACNAAWLWYGVLSLDPAVLVTNVVMVLFTLATFWYAAVGRRPETLLRAERASVSLAA